MVEQPSLVVDPAIRAYYDRAPEESRLELGPSQLEQLRTRELILRHAPEPPAVVLDVGGAAGAYAFWLAERGYEVHLIDAVPRLIEVARRRNEHATRRLTSFRVADARALPEGDHAAVERDLSDGHHRNPTDRLNYFTTAYFHRPEDLRREVMDAGLDVQGLYGVEGPGWIFPDFVDRWTDPARGEILL